MESYRTVRAGEEAVGEVVDRKSRFIAQLVHVECEEDAAEHIAAVRSRHFDARHNVPAWILAASGRAMTASRSAQAACPPLRCCAVPTYAMCAA